MHQLLLKNVMAMAMTCV